MSKEEIKEKSFKMYKELVSDLMLQILKDCDYRLVEDNLDRATNISTSFINLITSNVVRRETEIDAKGMRDIEKISIEYFLSAPEIEGFIPTEEIIKTSLCLVCDFNMKVCLMKSEEE